jgi:hypothetical protein
MVEPVGPRGEPESAPPSSDAASSAQAADPRLMAAWQAWLGALATDADAAIAAAQVYRELPEPARDAWLDALTEDSPALAVPAVAIYAPLLAVESNPDRRARMERAIGDVGSRPDPRRARALRGIARDGARVVALVSPLYLRFVEVLWCRYVVDEGFVWVRHDSLISEQDSPADGARFEDVVLEATPITPVIEELAHAVLAQRRRGRELPAPLSLFAHLFDARVGDDADDDPLR